MPHVSVLESEVLLALDIKSGQTFLDGTINGGGHSEAVYKFLKDKVKIVGIDLDGEALKEAGRRLESLGAKPILLEGNFSDIKRLLQKIGLKSVDKVLLDLGMSSNQLDLSNRGFSFLRDEPLLMTFKSSVKEGELSAKDVVNNFSPANLELILKGFGQERYGKKIVESIVRARKLKKIERTSELVEIIKYSVPSYYRRGRIHFATRTFQALRIAVNNELENLKIGLAEIFDLLSLGGRVAVISFHSLEDRIVKRFINEKKKVGSARSINKKPVVPNNGEINLNKRSRSAKLRIFEKNEIKN